MNNITQLRDLGIDLKGKTSGQLKTLCPKCSHLRKKKKEPCLSVNIDEGTWTCWNNDCKWQGGVGVTDEKTYVRPVFAESPLGDKATAYMKSRGISLTTIKKHKMTEEVVYVPKNQKKMPCIVWNYFRSGDLINKKYRSADKGFKMETGAELIFYNIDSMADSKQVIITEGEFDCMSYDECGFQHVISVPNGANVNTNNLEYLNNCYEFFEGVEKIYLAVDADEAGESLMSELSRRLGRDRCFKVSYPEGCKDANQTLVNHGIDAVKQTISRAEAFPIEGVITASDVKDDILRLYRTGMERGVEVGELGAEFDSLCSFKTSMLYVITGIPAHGKSTVLNYIEILLAAKHGWKFAIFSPEHYPLEYFIYKYCD
jgi:twinkle protein